MGTNIKLTLHTDRVMKWLDDTGTKRMMAACLHMQGEIQNTLSGQRSGKVYRVPGTKHKTYTSSAPGEPPASATGRLRKSIRFRVEGGFRELHGIVGTDIEYAPHLERGTHKMAARPFMRPTFERERLKIKEILSRKWD